MKRVCICWELTSPYKLKWYWPSEGYKKPSFDIYFESNTDNHDFVNNILKLNEIIKNSINSGAKYTFNISGPCLEQIVANKELLKSFKDITNTNCVEFTASPYYQSVSFMFHDKSEFISQIEKHVNLIKNTFHQNPQTLINTQLFISDEITKLGEELGFTCMIGEGSHNILQKDDPTYLYKNHIPLLLRHINLSEDIEKRFTNHTWSGYPLIADKFTAWIDSIEGDIITLYLDYDSIIKHLNQSDLIIKFIEELPKSLAKAGIEMVNPLDVTTRCKTYPLSSLKKEMTARYGVNSLVGNHVQHIYMHELEHTLYQINKTDNKGYQDLHRCFQQNSIFLDMNSTNYPLAYENAVNLFSIFSDFKRGLIIGEKDK